MKNEHKDQKNALIGELATGIIHSINNPLTAISMMSDKIQYLLDEYREGEELDAESLQNANRLISKTIEDLAPLLNSVNSFAKDTNHDTFSWKDISVIKNNVMHMVYHLLNKNKIKFYWHIEEDDYDLEFKGDINNISYSLISCIKNTVNSLDDNSSSRELNIYIKKNEQGVCFTLNSNYKNKESNPVESLGLKMAKDFIDFYGGEYSEESTGEINLFLINA